jgi:hypothetical protein
MTLLYRGVSKRVDSILNGQIKPKGYKSEVTAYHDGKIKYDGTFTHGESEDNAVRAQQIESGLYDNCFISTTKDEKTAIRFATNGYSESGWVYIIDSSIFKDCGVTSKEFPDPKYPHEMEVSIMAKDCGYIPEVVIIGKYEVNPNGTKK